MAKLTYGLVCEFDLPHTNAYVKRMPRGSPKARAKGRGAAALGRDTAKRQTREALIAAALELFAEEGLDAPSLDAICDRAGFTRGAFYVHFPDRDALLVAVMEKVGEAFLAGVFEHLARSSGPEAGARQPSALAAAAERFVAAIKAGAYPLMPPPGVDPLRAGSPRGGPQVRPHQLLDACARSPVVRERYRALVEASVAQVAELARADQAAGAVRAELEPRQVGTALLAAIIGAQTMAELGVSIDPALLARTLVAALRP